MPPFLRAELGSAWDLGAALRYGTLPVIVAGADPDEALVAYSEVYLNEEIRGERAVRNLDNFERFLQVAGLMHGQSLNLAGIGRDVGIARTTVEGHFRVLEDTLIGWSLPGFEPRLRVRERAHPKWYFVDPGLARAAAGRSGPVDELERGALLEGLVINEVRMHLKLRRERDALSHWSPAAGGTEVDLVLDRHGERVAIEIKAASVIDNTRLKGLRAIASLPGLRRRILVAPVPFRELTEDGIEIVPVDDFLAESAAASLFP